MFAGAYKPSAATAAYSLKAKGAALTHASNEPAPITIISRADKYLNIALAIGRVLSLNFVRTLRGWISLALFWISLFGLIALFKLNQKRQVWRHERAIAELEKMK
jgi:predicted neuraminidase